MRNKLFPPFSLVILMIAGMLLTPSPSAAHPLGNFSISHYSGIQVEQDFIELRYFIDMAEIPTFQEIQATGIVPEEGHSGLVKYLNQKTEMLKEALVLVVNGHRLPLKRTSSHVIFPAGAGGLPTMKIGVRYRAVFDATALASMNRLFYRDTNFSDRVGWKEIVAVAGPDIEFVISSVPEKDRSLELADYPTDLLNSPPQDLEARLAFTVKARSQALASVGPLEPTPPDVRTRTKTGPNQPLATSALKTERSSTTAYNEEEAAGLPERIISTVEAGANSITGLKPIGVQANRQATPRNPFTELLSTKQLSLWVIMVAAAVAAGLGAFHALEPGHGKTVVAAYLVGSRGTAWHALVLGLIVTASHTAGVYLLGAVTLYASRYIIPERLYPWLGVVSGFTIAGLGFYLFLKRYAGASHPHSHTHSHRRGHGHHYGGMHHSDGPQDGQEHSCANHGHLPQRPDRAVSLRELFALGITGGIVPCPAALVVLLSAVALRRVGFGLFLIVAFSLGLAAVLIAIGVLMVYARRFMSRFQGEGTLIIRWLPLTSAAVITLFGVAMAVQSLVSAGSLPIQLS